MKREFLETLTGKYWDSWCMLHFTATFLDPSLRGFLFVKNVNNRKTFLEQVKDSIHSLANEFNSLLIPDTAVPDSTLTSTDVSMLVYLEETETPVKKKAKVDPFSWFRNSTCYN